MLKLIQEVFEDRPRLIEQNREPRNKPSHICSVDF